MKYLCTPLFFLYLMALNPLCWAQNKKNSSEIYTRITIPIFVDFVEKTDWTNPKYEDTEKTWADNSFEVYVDLKYVPLDAGHNRFAGKYIEDLMPFATYSISGIVSEDRKMLKQLVVKKNAEYSKGGYELTEKWTVAIFDMPLINGIGQLSKEKTKVRIDGYENRTVSRSDSRIEYKDYIFKSINNDKIQPPPYGGNFNIRLNIDGPPSYTIRVEDVRGPDPSWEPPAALVNPGNFTHDIEPNSISFYANYDGLDEESKMWTKYYYWNSMFRLFDVAGLKVLERGELKKILREIDLSQSGLVCEETKVNSGRLMKEQVAVITKMDLQQHTFECDIQSRKGEKKIIVMNITLQNRDFAYSELNKKVNQIINSCTSKPLIPLNL